MLKGPFGPRRPNALKIDEKTTQTPSTQPPKRSTDAATRDAPRRHHSMPPLNMPPTYKDYERGRVLVAFNSTWESQQTVPSVAEPEPSLLVEPAWFEAVWKSNFTAPSC